MLASFVRKSTRNRWQSWKRKKFTYLVFALRHPFRIKIFSQYIQHVWTGGAQRNHADAEGHSRQLETVPFCCSLPANNVPEQRERLAVLVSTGKQKRCSAPNFLMNRWNTSRTKWWRMFTNDMRPMWTARPPKRWYRALWYLPARRLVWSSKWMTWKLCKRTSKKILLLTRRYCLRFEIWHCTAAAYLWLPMPP